VTFCKLKFYLSSYRLGNKKERLKDLAPADNKKTAYISNAIDFSTDLERRKKNENFDIESLRKAGLEAENLDLRKFFGEREKLKGELERFGCIWVSGGSVFVLRQAMKMSCFDEIIVKDMRTREVLYGGYSAGVCVLARNLKGIELMDNPSFKPYGDSETIWEGLGILDYLVVPHYRSDHPEAQAAERMVEYMKEHNLPFRALRDGEVIIIDKVF
jgi:dipeptidase E